MKVTLAIMPIIIDARTAAKGLSIMPNSPKKAGRILIVALASPAFS
jgi:hypothetical protein